MLATRIFLQNEKILFLAKVIAFLNLLNTITVRAACANFNCNCSKINF